MKPLPFFSAIALSLSLSLLPAQEPASGGDPIQENPQAEGHEAPASPQDGNTSGAMSEGAAPQPGSPTPQGAENEPDARPPAAPPRQDPPAIGVNVLQILSGAQDFSTFAAALKASGLADRLQSAGAYTVFAPTNDAFAALPDGRLEELLKVENREALDALLSLHVVPNKLLHADLQSGQVRSLEQIPLQVTANGDDVRIGEARITRFDISGNNGVIHVVDKVLKPVE